MQTEAAVLWERHEGWSVEPIELDPPREGEVLVKLLHRACATPTSI